MLPPLVRAAAAAIAVGLATVFIPDHSPRALAVFLVSHSALGLLLFALAKNNSKQPNQLFGFATGGLVAAAALIVLLIEPAAAQLASLVALAWTLIWLAHWLLLSRSPAAVVLQKRDLVIQVGLLFGLFVALLLSFADPIASTGFVGIYLVGSGLHLAIVAASPKVG